MTLEKRDTISVMSMALTLGNLDTIRFWRLGILSFSTLTAENMVCGASFRLFSGKTK